MEVKPPLTGLRVFRSAVSKPSVNRLRFRPFREQSREGREELELEDQRELPIPGSAIATTICQMVAQICHLVTRLLTRECLGVSGRLDIPGGS